MKSIAEQEPVVTVAVPGKANQREAALLADVRDRHVTRRGAGFTAYEWNESTGRDVGRWVRLFEAYGWVSLVEQERDGRPLWRLTRTGHAVLNTTHPKES